MRTLLDVARRVRDGLRDTVDGWMHAQRYERARRRLDRSDPRRILFLCLGNICRSPLAERLLRSRLGDGVMVESAGFIGPDRPPPPEALESAQKLGVEHGDHRSRTVTDHRLRAAEIILVFDGKNVRKLKSSFPGHAEKVVWLGDLDPVWSGRRAVDDPWGQGASAFDETFERIARCVEEMARALEK